VILRCGVIAIPFFPIGQAKGSMDGMLYCYFSIFDKMMVFMTTVAADDRKASCAFYCQKT